MAAHIVSDVQTHPTQRNRAGGMAEELCALAGVVLAIIGLAGGSQFFDAVAAIVIGAAFIFETWTALEGSSGHEDERSIWAARVAGWGGVVLGILALLRLGPTVLAPIALLVFGAGLVFATGFASHTLRMVIGAAAIVLGILSIVQLYPRTLTLIGFIAVAGVLLLTGPAVAWRTHRGVATPA